MRECVRAGYVMEEENKENDGEEERGRDHAWHMSMVSRFGTNKKKKNEVYMCELENGGWESPGKKTKK